MADVELLFGVLGGGSISGASGNLIQTQLNSIVGNINKKPIKIKAQLDPASLASIKTQIRTLSGNAMGSVSSNGFKISGDIASLKNISSHAVRASSSIAKLKQITNQLERSYARLNSQPVVNKQNAQVQSLIAKYSRLLALLRDANGAPVNSTKMKQAQAEVNAYCADIERLIGVERKAGAASKSVNDDRIASLKQVATAQDRINKLLTTNPMLARSPMGTQLKTMLSELTSGAPVAIKRLREIEAEIARIKAEAAVAGKLGKTLGGTVLGMFEKFGGWSLVTRSMLYIRQAFHGMIKDVRSLDSAMTELRKVTDETDSTYSKFFDKSIDRAKSLGATVTDTISATADFARLGYNVEEAQVVADAALVYKNVGDGIDSIDTASESIISTMQGFGVAASDAMLVVDKFNEVGNNFAISSAGIGDALVRSAAALSAANNSLDESIALVTATNKVVQDPEKVGTTLKTVSMYLRAAKTEAEEAGIETDGMADSMSKLRGEILALTGNQVDIQLDEDTFKSTYQIMKEIAGVWDQISDVSQANILEKLGGKRNSNVVAALIQNFDEAEKILETSANASGSALRENEKYLDSIEGKIQKLNVSAETFSSTMLESDTFKGVIDGATSFLDILTRIVDMFGSLPTTIAAITGIASAVNMIKSPDGNTGFFNLFKDDKGVYRLSLFRKDLGEISNTFKQINKSGSKLTDAKYGMGALFASFTSPSNYISAYNDTVDSVKNTSKALADAQAKGLSGKELDDYSNAAKRAADSQDTLVSSMRKSNSSLHAYLTSLNGAKASMAGYVNYCKQAGIAVNLLGIKAKAAAVGMQALQMAGSMLMTMGVAWVITTVIQKISELIHKQEELRQETTDAAASYKTSAASISDYKAEIDSLKTSIESGTLSQDQLYDAKQRLNSIQDELLSSYGAEVSQLNLVAMSADEAAAAMERLAKAEAEKFLRENAEGIEDARVVMERETTRGVSFSRKNLNDYQYAKLRDIANANGITLKSNTSDQSMLTFTADTKDAYDILQKFREDAEAQGVNLGDIEIGDGKSLDDAVVGLQDKVLDITSEYDETYRQYINSSIAASDEYSSALQGLTAAQDNYNNVISKNYASEEERAEAIEDAIAGIDKAKAAMDDLTFDETEASIKEFFDDFWGEIDSASSGERLKLQLDGIGEGDGDAYILKVKNALESLGVAGKDGKIEIAEILSLMQDIEATGGEGFEVQSKALETLSSMAEEAGVSFEHFLNILSETGYIKGYIGDALSALTNNLYTVESGFNSASTAIENYKAALEGGEKSDNFTAYAEAYDSFQAEVKAGTTNSNAFWAGAELLLGEDKIRELEYNSQAIIAAVNSVQKVWANEGDFGVGFLNYIDGLDNAGKLIDENNQKLIDIQKNSDGTWDFNFEPENLEKLLPLLNMTEEGFYACLEAVDMWANLNPADMDQVTERIDSLGLAVETANEKIIASEPIEEQLASIYGKENAFQIMSELEDMGYKFVTANDSAEDLLKTATELGAVEVLKGFDEKGQAIETTRVHVDEFVESLSKMGMSQDDIESILGTLNEMSGIEMVDAEGAFDGYNKSAQTAKNATQRLIEEYRHAYDALMADPGNTAAQKRVQELREEIEALPDDIKLQFGIRTEGLDSGIASIEETIADYQRLLGEYNTAMSSGNLQLQQKIGQDLVGIESKLKTALKDIPVETNLDVDNLRAQLSNENFELQISSDEVSGVVEAVRNGVISIGEAVDTIAAKQMGDLGSAETNSALSTTLQWLNNINAVTFVPKTQVVYRKFINTGDPAEADGTNNAEGGHTLVGELGRELVVQDGRYYTVGDYGAEFVNLKKGDIVFNHIETERLLRGERGVRGRALAEGNAAAVGFEGARPPGSSGVSSTSTKKSTYKANLEVEADTSKLEESMKDALDEIKEEVERIIGDYEHKIFLTDKNNGNLEDIVAMYKKMQDTVHDYADQYRAKGLDENSDYITDLQKQWWEYEEAIVEAISTAYEEARSLHENDITLLENSLEDAISVGDVGGMREYTDSIIDAKKAMRSLLQEQIKMYRAEGLADNSDEITEAMDLWHDLGTEIEEAAQQIIDSVSDMVDEVEDAYNTLHKAADEYAESGYITVDTLQDIISLGPQYLAFLIDENGQLVINEERINAVIKARTEQLAIETALNYVKQIRTAVENGEIATLNNLLYATQVTTGATWELVYANLALAGLNGEQYAAAMRNINALRALSITAQKSIGQINKDTKKKTLESLEEMQDGMENIVDYVMDMLADRLEQQIDALEEQKDQYADIIDLKKESLEATKAEDDYQKSQAEKLKKIAKLQAQIELLKLDDSREAQARRIALEEELAELQGDLADEQADKLLETQTDTLDKMQEANEKRVDAEIEELEKTASSYEKRWQQAIDYIENNWSTLHKELLAWNYEYGDVLNSEITDAYNAASAALQKYGSDFSTVLGRIRSEVESLKNSMDSSFNTNLGSTYTPSDDELAEADKLAVGELLSEMKANSVKWDEAHKVGNKALEKELADDNVRKAKQLEEFGIYAVKDYGIKDGRWNGVWYDKDGTNLYQKYAAYIYHKGGIVGGGDVKANEQFALLENDEWVLSRKMVENLSAQMDRINMLRGSINTFTSGITDMITSKTNGFLNSIANSPTAITVTIGDTIISGANGDTVKQHMRVSEDMVNQIARVIGIRR